MKKQIRAWMAFDWASQPFHTVIVTFIFAPYFASHLIGNEVQGQAMIGYMTTIASLAVAIGAPIATALSDYGGGRKKWILALSVLFSIFCFGMMFEASVFWVMLAFVMSYFFIEMLLVFTNAYLPEITEKDQVGRISNMAWGIGYAGGLIVLFLFLIFLVPIPGTPKTLAGLSPLFGENFGAASGPASTIWYVIFMIPFFIYMPETKRKAKAGALVKESMNSLRNAFLTAWHDRKLFWFFLTSLFSRDALAGIFTFGSLYAAGVLNWSLFFLVIYGVVLNITGILGGLYAARVVSRRSTEYAVKWSLWIFLGLTLVALTTNLNQVIFVPVAEGSILPHIAFFICGMLIGACAGSLQGSLRGLVGPLTDGKIPTGEAFGLYGMIGRATAFLSPLLVAVATQISQSVQYGAWPIIGLFAISLLAYYKFESIN